MSDKKNESDILEESGEAASVGDDAVEIGVEDGADDDGDDLSSDPVAEAREELEQMRDKYLRLAAEYDNYRKRSLKEITEAGVRAQASMLGRLLEALDDLGRVSDLDPEQTAAKDIIQGVELVEKKFLREMETMGVERVGEPGEVFDPNTHEALGSVPTDDPDQENTVANVFQVGYRLGDSLVRPARVQVYMQS